MKINMRSISMVMLFGVGTALHAQSEKVDTSKVYDLSEVQYVPEYPGGQEKMYAFLKERSKYPQDAFLAKVQGKVYVQFTIDTDGRVVNVNLKRGVFPSLDAEALRVIASMPVWVPGRMNDSPVPTRFIIPMDFKL